MADMSSFQSKWDELFEKFRQEMRQVFEDSRQEWRQQSKNLQYSVQQYLNISCDGASVLDANEFPELADSVRQPKFNVEQRKKVAPVAVGDEFDHDNAEIDENKLEEPEFEQDDPYEDSLLEIESLDDVEAQYDMHPEGEYDFHVQGMLKKAKSKTKRNHLNEALKDFLGKKKSTKPKLKCESTQVLMQDDDKITPARCTQVVLAAEPQSSMEISPDQEHILSVSMHFVQKDCPRPVCLNAQTHNIQMFDKDNVASFVPAKDIELNELEVIAAEHVNSARNQVPEAVMHCRQADWQDRDDLFPLLSGVLINRVSIMKLCYWEDICELFTKFNKFSSAAFPSPATSLLQSENFFQLQFS